jgi:hypothetical protein
MCVEMQDDAPPGTDAAPATANAPAQPPPAQAAAATYPGYGAAQYNQYAAYQQYYQQYQQAVCDMTWLMRGQGSQ